MLNLIPAKHAAKVRATYDQATDKVIATIVKARVADINLHFPDNPFDCRISVNLEMDWTARSRSSSAQSVAGRDALPDRRKDRLSYTQSHYQVDLTQVTHSNKVPHVSSLPILHPRFPCVGHADGVADGDQNASRVDKEHEIEIEVSAATLVDQGQRAANGEPNQYFDLVSGLVNNVRVLAGRLAPS